MLAKRFHKIFSYKSKKRDRRGSILKDEKGNDLYDVSTELGTCNKLKFWFEVIRGLPVQHKAVKHVKTNSAEFDALQKAVKERLEKQIWDKESVEFQSYAHAILQNGKWRMVINFITLNAHTRPFNSEPNNLADVLMWMFKTTFTLISSFDMKSAYHQILNDESICKYCGVGTTFGTYRAKRMEFGHAQAPATLAKAVYLTFESIIWDSMAAYFDDLYSKGDSAFAALKAVGRAFSLLEEAGFKISLDKSWWLTKELIALGFRVTTQGISPDPRKADVFRTWPLPEDAAALMSYLGSAGYLRGLIPHFAEYVQPLYQLLQECGRAYHARRRARQAAKLARRKAKDAQPFNPVISEREAVTSADQLLSATSAKTKPLTSEDGNVNDLEVSTYLKPKGKKHLRDMKDFYARWDLTNKWTERAKSAFYALNKVIADGLFLAGFDPNLPIVVESDASNFCIGAVIAKLQPDTGALLPVQFYSRKLEPAETTLPAVLKEALSAWEGRRTFAVYLQGRKYTHVYDQKALTYANDPRMSGKLLGIIQDLRSESGAKPIHRPGHLHGVDGISRVIGKTPVSGPYWKKDYRKMNSREESIKVANEIVNETERELEESVRKPVRPPAPDNSASVTVPSFGVLEKSEKSRTINLMSKLDWLETCQKDVELTHAVNAEDAAAPTDILSRTFDGDRKSVV
jgi:hypothetical protein